jgi:PKD repeat protein
MLLRIREIVLNLSIKLNSMKNLLLATFFLAFSFTASSQAVINMCSTPNNSTSVLTGTLYDSGGPFSTYQNGENCSLLISPGCQATITLVFSQFQTESCCDPISIYNGTSTSAPLLGTYAGSSLPPTLVATSGNMFIYWSTDGSVVYNGFAATWTAIVSGTIAPVANFTMNPTPMLSVPFQFTDQTTNAPNQWFWQFGDATTSTQQNPVKTYTSSGLKTVTLTATNCNSSATVTNTLMVQSAPSISVSPASLSASTTCGGTVSVPLTVYNIGSGPLSFSITGNSSSGPVNVLAITNYVDMTTEYPNTIAAINSYFTNFTVTQHFLTSTAAFSTALVGKQVLLIPEQETYLSGFMQTYSATINNFVSNGGTAILCGSGFMSQINDIGLFTCSFISNTSSNLTVVDTSASFMTTQTLGSIPNANATWYSTFTNSGNTDHVKFGSNNVCTQRMIGLGKAIYLGFDYFAYSNQHAKMVAYAVKNPGNFPSWLTTTFSSATVAASASTSVNFTFNTTNLSAGIYTYNIIVNSNDPSAPSVTVPVSYTVFGAPSVSVSANCINFGTITQYTNKLDSIVIYNTGCATLSVTSMNTTNSVFTYTPSSNYTVAAFSSKKIKVNFNPLTAGSFIDTLYIFNNALNKKICLTGNATTAPSISVSPTSLSANLPACNATQTVNLTVFNTGGPNLIISTTGSSNGTVGVLAITNYVDMAQEYPNMITSINSYFTNYTVTQHFLTSVSALQTALVGKQVLLIPEQETYSSGFMQTYSATINNFVSNGGLAIQCGTGFQYQINDIGLFNCSYIANTTANVNVVDTSASFMTTQTMGSMPSPNATWYSTFTNPGITDYVTTGGYNVVSRRNIGSGKAIYLGFDWYNYNTQSSKMIAYAIKSAGSSVSWLNWSPSSATISPSSSVAITFTFNTGNLSAGTYTYNYVISSNDPLTPSYTVPITLVVGTNPCANFSFTNPNNCTGVVTFTQNCINTVTTYSWNFGNSTTSTQQNPTCNYTSPGTYTVTLTACNGTVCSTISKTLTISNVGGPISAACTPTNLYTSSYYGILNVTLNTINNNSGLTYQDGGYKDFSCTNQTSLTIGNSYLLNISTNTNYYENVSVWIDFDNSGSFTASEQVIQSLNTFMTHSINFTPPTTAVLYTPLRMRVIDESSSYSIVGPCTNVYYGQIEDYAVTIMPNNVPPVANFIQTTNQCAGTVAFTDLSSNNPTSWLWNFGNSAVSNLQNPIYTYTVAGTYTVTLIATNQFGSNFYSQVITVNPLTFNLAYSTPQIMNMAISFSTSLNNAISYVWDFGDGNFSGSQFAQNTYTAAGTYTVKLTIVSGTCVNTMSTTISIGNPMGVQNISMDNMIRVFPNPFKNEANISVVVMDPMHTSIELTNSIGQKVNKVDFGDLKLGENKFVIKDIPPGIYFINVKSGQRTKVFKLIATD